MKFSSLQHFHSTLNKVSCQIDWKSDLCRLVPTLSHHSRPPTTQFCPRGWGFAPNPWCHVSSSPGRDEENGDRENAWDQCTCTNPPFPLIRFLVFVGGAQSLLLSEVYTCICFCSFIFIIKVQSCEIRLWPKIITSQTLPELCFIIFSQKSANTAWFRLCEIYEIRISSGRQFFSLFRDNYLFYCSQRVGMSVHDPQFIPFFQGTLGRDKQTSAHGQDRRNRQNNMTHQCQWEHARL